MDNFKLSLVCLVVSLLVFRYAKRCNVNPEDCANRFITRFGVPQSIFAVLFTGHVEKARKAFLEDNALRRKYIIEQYVIALAILLAGIILLFIEA
jgi:hypothetical protein